ncbi:hypothetical protein QWY85_04310 [Neolewinella lacunae]|uniref:Uncharacterized protein n=1 Tax=Neolewinella lacunae TaxID=1517758 RepID=A0A923PNK9_9BACT|nr:hypothetical protein [Neolewinella lacunae]MBC6996749.1 hypothetical protein [Neolewinella lacunae]MDN3633869.1 hypothetical protein [Neolewinella lacunae]
MHPLQKHLQDTQFKDLAGSHLAGTIALSDELINLGIGEFLASLRTPPAAAADPGKAARADGLNPAALLANLEVDQLRWRTEHGRSLLDVKLRLT